MALVLAGAVLYVLWSAGVFLPAWICWEEGGITDASGDYEISLTDKKVRIAYGGADVWESPKGVKVQQILSFDMDRDNTDELILLCWKRGRYGKYKPFWIEKDEKSWSQHIFVYEYNKDKILPKWMSSYIGQDVKKMADFGKEASEKRLLLEEPKGTVSCWRWGSWGFIKEDAAVSFAVFGDNLIHEPIYRYGLYHDGNFDFLYENIGDILEKSDISVINQETPFVTEEEEYSDYPRFGTPLQVGEAIAKAGFDIVTCATNHALDRGSAGVRTTKGFFTAHDILCLGIQTEEESKRKPYELITKNGITFALFNAAYGTNGISLPEDCPYMVHLLDDEGEMRRDIASAREKADIVIVFAHWGTENSAETDAFQKKWTNIFLESKVDVVVGSHPHVLQDCEMLEGFDGHKMLVYYSVGNFVSAQPEKSCVKGGAATFTIAPSFDGYAVTEYNLTPLVITWQKGGKYTVKVQEAGK